MNAIGLRQKEILIDLARGKQPQITSQTYRVSSALGQLIDKEIVSQKNKLFYINDKFFQLWLKQQCQVISN